jgi:transcriptional regulator with XRE-family HTH domain
MGFERVGLQLRQQRRMQGKTLKQVAESAGLSLSYIANLERGRGNPTLEALGKVAAALDMTVESLLGDTQPDHLAPEFPKTLAAFVADEEFRRRVARMADALGRPVDRVHEEVVRSMVSAPRRSSAEPTRRDWERLLETFEYMSQHQH